MNLQSFLWEYGEKVPGYDVTVINEREARAAAGILFALGMIVIFVGIGYNHIIVARVYLAFLFIDFFARTLSPTYSPSLLLGKYIVRNQKPEYVGGLQKRFAWSLGWFISWFMMNWFVLHWDITFYKVMLCVLCLTLMFLETAFGVCVGCMIYKWITRKNPEHCPGGVCEMRVKEPIQRFNPIQATIAIVTAVALFAGIYLFLAKTESKTFFGQFLHEAVLTKAQLQKEEDEKFERESAGAFENDDF
ncbi:DUF4395 domain-containing protein [Sulfurimonas paralvinellae]|uniref:DUF4395 domain-containing protein n=1 Tax=Sulfurimonas paralvinellae TaxID=317658 RepID=A0A7M1BCU5_9BACT|nr:DUF4395 domain-containing protein [Sulfurimonas paralvinellae]QOP46612.1 DUF4395 domain-containing protein [Sulfurimonas paralvinellae]